MRRNPRACFIGAALASALLVLPAAGPASPAVAEAAPDLPEGAREGVARCAKCHARIAAEWRKSQHARSLAETDPIYRELRRQAVETLGPPAEARCRQCHEPAWAGKAREAGAPVEGVSCVACHRIPAGHPAKRLEDGRRSAFAAGTGAKGGTDGAGGLCLTCHAELKNPEGQPVCTTADEATTAGAPPCITCHMPERKGEASQARDGRRAHSFPGAFDPAFLRTAARLDLDVRRGPDGPEARVTVTNNRTGHSLPTGNPMRALWLRVEALGAGQEVLWRNGGDNLGTDDPGAVFQRVFRDAAGNGPVPPFKARGPATDSRLAAGQSRTRTWVLPEGTKEVRARLEFLLGPAPLLKKAGLSAEAADPVPMAEARAAIP